MENTVGAGALHRAWNTLRGDGRVTTIFGEFLFGASGRWWWGRYRGTEEAKLAPFKRGERQSTSGRVRVRAVTTLAPLTVAPPRIGQLMAVRWV